MEGNDLKEKNSRAKPGQICDESSVVSVTKEGRQRSSDRKSRRKSSHERSRSRTRRRSSSSSNADKRNSLVKSPSFNDENTEREQEKLKRHSAVAAPDVRVLQTGSSDKEMRRISKLEDPLEKQMIREKLRAKPGVRKEGGDVSRPKGPMVARPPSSSSPSPIDGSSASPTPPSSFTPSSSSSSTSTAPIRRPRSLLPQRSRSPSSQGGKESPFAKQVVNRVASPTSPRLPRHRSYVSPSNSRPGSPTSGHRRASSPQGESLFTMAVGVLKKRVERALHARLFLLSQIGPNSFLIGGDSPDHKYKVTIGTQNCNCGRGPFCVHLLFVMLRVFKVPEDDNLLWSRTLKNYEVELLFSKYEAMKKKKLKQSASTNLSTRSRRSAQSPSSAHPSRSNSPCASTGSSDQREDEDLCPICLLDMVEGESLVVCQNGCHNKLHHHCVAIWEEECKRQQEPMVCPLCRAVWTVPRSEGSHDGTSAPQNSRCPSPDSQGEESDGMDTPLFETFHQKKERWKEFFGEDVSESMFSRDWSIRETALHTFSRDLSDKLRHYDTRTPRPHEVDTCEANFEADMMTMECGFEMVAMACTDPVYKVYVAALRALRTLLMNVHCSTEDHQNHLRTWLQPITAAILIKCADGNRRTSQLSVSAMLELARGDSGELAVSKELSCTGCIGLGGVDYVLSCLIDDIHMNLGESPSWQHILGRLNVLERVISDFPDHFTLTDNGCQRTNGNKMECLMSIARCTSSYLNNQHQRIWKMSKRIFVNVAKILVSESSAFGRICDMVASIEPSELASRMQRRLLKIFDDYENAKQETGNEGEEPQAYNRSGSCRRKSSSSRTCETATDAPCNGSRLPEASLPAAASTPKTRLRSQDVPLCSLKCTGTPPQRPACNDNTSASDLSDLSVSPTTPCDNPITFKSEVAASSPKKQAVFDFPLHGIGSKNCKDAVEAEEAEALAIAMESSLHTQSPLPKVPGLRPEKEGDVIVRIRHEKSSDSTDGNSSPSSQQYVEGKHWVKGSVLGTGAFSTCYMGRDIKTGTLMAVKQISFYRNSSSEQDKTTEVITKEIKLMGTLDHPHVVRLLGATQHEGHFNVFVEWMPGGSVSSLLQSFGAFSDEVTIKYVHQICLGLAYLHDNRVIHRDLKGANLLLDSTGHHLRIADLGTAAEMAAQVTRTDEFKGQFLGTIAFMAPEVLRGEQYGRSCDIWSLGCCVFEMCTGQPPWNAHETDNHLQLLFKIASAQGPPPIPDSFSPSLRDIALRCMESIPSNRPSVVELLKHSAFRHL